MFHGQPRYDSVLVNTIRGLMFARLVDLFNFVVDGKNYPTALVQACDAPVRQFQTIDLELGLYRVKARPRSSCEFISVKSIIRGAVLVPDFNKEDEYLVMDVLDPDMFLRVRRMQY